MVLAGCWLTFMLLANFTFCGLLTNDGVPVDKWRGTFIQLLSIGIAMILNIFVELAILIYYFLACRKIRGYRTANQTPSTRCSQVFVNETQNEIERPVFSISTITNVYQDAHNDTPPSYETVMQEKFSSQQRTHLPPPSYSFLAYGGNSNSKLK